MGIETILLMFHSFLDNNPYTYEPGGRDDPTYTVYVLYQSWYTCLIRYFQYETIDIFKEFMNSYILLNIGDIFDQLYDLNYLYPKGTYYSRCFEIDDYSIDYSQIINYLQYYCDYTMEYTETTSDITYFSETDTIVKAPSSVSTITDHDFECNICFDTTNKDNESNDNNDIIILSCYHKFHLTCIKEHLKENNDVCPMCRNEFSSSDKLIISTNNEYMINPFTKRKIKINGKTHKYLIENNLLN
jgi:hypothetical protein